MAESDAVAAFEGVSHEFAAQRVLRNVHLTVRRGDVYGLLGLNGAGKTTTLRLLLRLLRRQSGRISLFGAPIERDWLQLAARLGATVEAPALYPNLSGLTNLSLLHDLGGGGGRGPEEALESVGLTHAAHLAARKYSQGMLQRLWVAQALLGRPELLVLDEPTSNLDPQGILEVRELVRSLAREAGVTVIFSSHQLSEVEDVCNRVAILHRGEVRAEQSVAELLRSEECWVRIESPRGADLLARLEQIPWCGEPELVEGGSPGSGLAPCSTPPRSDAEERAAAPGCVRVRLPRPRCAELNAELVRGGLEIASFAPERVRLETFFHDAIGGEGAGREEPSDAA